MRRAASGSGACRPLRVVLYHHVSDQGSSLVDQLGVSTPPDVFEAHVRRMARDYEVVSLDAVLSGEFPHRALLITFDDGYRSVAEVALPILRRLGLPSVFFVTGECLERDSLPLDNLLSHLSASVGFDRLGSGARPRRTRHGHVPAASRPRRRHAIWPATYGGEGAGGPLRPRSGDASRSKRDVSGLGGPREAVSLWLRGREPRSHTSVLSVDRRRGIRRLTARRACSAARVVDRPTRFGRLATRTAAAKTRNR